MDDQFRRIERLPPYVFNIIGDLKQQARAAGEDIIDFGMGNPDQPTPGHIVDKLVETARRGDTHGYSQSKGIPRLRKAICDWYQRRFDVSLDPASEAIVTLGSKEGLAHLALATTGPGDAILVPNPSYPIHPYGFVISGADIRHVPMGDNEDEFFAELEKGIQTSWPRPKMLVLNFPSNPTAQCVELEFYERVIKVAREHSIWVIQDLAYADLCYDGYVAPSILQVEGARDVAVEFFSMSKSYNMPGWRIGFCCGNKVAGGSVGAYEVLSGLRHVHADTGGCDCRAGGRPDLCGGNLRHVPVPSGCVVQRTQRCRLAGHSTQGHHVCLGQDTGVLSGDGLRGVRQEVVGRGAGGGLSGHRLWRVR